MLNIPESAFVPPRFLTADEHRAFVQRRDRLLAACTPAQQQCLCEIAHSRRLRRASSRLPMPKVLADSFLAEFDFRYQPWTRPSKPSLAVRALAKVHAVQMKVERWRGRRAQSAFIGDLAAAAEVRGPDALLGVCHFFRLLPLELAYDATQALHEQLKALIDRCVADKRFEAQARMDAVVRCLDWPTDESVSNWDCKSELQKHIWPLLLSVADEAPDAAVRFVDEHWKRARTPDLMSTLHLLDTPELACQLAVKFKAHRPDFAAGLLGESIVFASFQHTKLPPAAVTALDDVMDASCRMLADWVIDSPRLAAESALDSMQRIMQFGNPEESYWRRCHRSCLALLRAMEPVDQTARVSMIAEIAFYGAPDAPLVTEAHQLFKACAIRRLGEREGWRGGLDSAVADVCRSVSVLEDKALSLRNRRVAARPDHFLLHSVEELLQNELKARIAGEPSAALQHITTLILALSNEALIRKFHRTLRDEFEVRARVCPSDAGLALKQLAKYCGYSQVEDEMYRRTLSQESFDALTPILEVISPADVAVARTGIGWSPRWGYR